MKQTITLAVFAGIVTLIACSIIGCSIVHGIPIKEDAMNLTRYIFFLFAAIFLLLVDTVIWAIMASKQEKNLNRRLNMKDEELAKKNEELEKKSKEAADWCCKYFCAEREIGLINLDNRKRWDRFIERRAKR